MKKSTLVRFFFCAGLTGASVALFVALAVLGFDPKALLVAIFAAMLPVFIWNAIQD